MSNKRVYRVIFHNQGKVYELYARRIDQGMLGFVEIEELLFDTHTNVVVDPSEERLKAEFEGVKRIHVPMHAIVRIDEVEKQGTAKITESGGNVTPLPTTLYTPRGDT